MSGTLDPLMLLRGYASGIFPMADSRDADDIFWVEPRTRAILPLDRFRVSRSLSKRIRSGRFRVSCDEAFPRVVEACADRDETWINPMIERATHALHATGNAHSLECWEGQDLVGGLYGVKLGRAFFGESMFSRRTDASKVALAWLVARLRVGHFTLLDCQFMTGHLASLGAITVSRERYAGLLASALSCGGVDGGVVLEGASGSAAGSSAGAVRPVVDLPPPDFRALDGLLDSAAPAGAAGPAGQLIAQLLGQTS